MKLTVLVIIFFCYCQVLAQATTEPKSDTTRKSSKPASVGTKPLYGIASFYADKFNGRMAADGSIYHHSKATAACNVLPLGTWIRVTNIRNRKSVIVKVTDRLHPKNTRIRSEEHTSELQSQSKLVCRLLLEKKTASGAARSRP